MVFYLFLLSVPRTFVHYCTQYLTAIEKSARFKFKSVTKHWVLTALKGLKESKSPGPDKIPVKVLKDAAELICVPLAIIFNAFGGEFSLKGGK